MRKNRYVPQGMTQTEKGMLIIAAIVPLIFIAESYRLKTESLDNDFQRQVQQASIVQEQTTINDIDWNMQQTTIPQEQDAGHYK